MKAKKFVVNGSKRGRLKKKWKKMTEKFILAKGLERSDVQDRASVEAWLQNRPTLARQENKLGSRKMKLIIKTPGTNG